MEAADHLTQRRDPGQGLAGAGQQQDSTAADNLLHRPRMAPAPHLGGMGFRSVPRG